MGGTEGHVVQDTGAEEERILFGGPWRATTNRPLQERWTREVARDAGQARDASNARRSTSPRAPFAFHYCVFFTFGENNKLLVGI